MLDRAEDAEDDHGGDAPREGERVTEVDRHVGLRMRQRRIMLGLSQQQLAQLVGVTYQQAHKYERGLNRISAGRLFQLARVMQVSIGWFFEGLAEPEDDAPPEAVSRICLELVRNCAAIGNDRHREALSQLARVLAGR
jgi:transcriptional regulator with XRE-family HTH domain